MFDDRLNHACLIDAALLSRARLRSLCARRRDAARARLADAAAHGAKLSAPTRVQHGRRPRAAAGAGSSSPTSTMPGWSSTTRTASACWATATPGAAPSSIFLARLGTHRATWARWARRWRCRRLRGGASGRDRDADANARSLHLHDRPPPLLAAAAQARVWTWCARYRAARAPVRADLALARSAATLRWPLLSSTTPIQPLIIGDAPTRSAVSDAAVERGIWVPAIRPPTVPAGSARLRITLSAAHSDADIDRLVAALTVIGAGRPQSRAAR